MGTMRRERMARSGEDEGQGEEDGSDMSEGLGPTSCEPSMVSTTMTTVAYLPFSPLGWSRRGPRLGCKTTLVPVSSSPRQDN